MEDQETRIQNALDYVRTNKGSSIRKAAIQFKVPRSTLQGRLAGRKTHAAANEPLRRLTAAEEASIVKTVLKMQEWGWPLRVQSLGSFATRCLKGKDNPEPPGTNWYARFLARHPELKFQKSRPPHQQRKDGASHETLSEWFESYQRIKEACDIADEDVYNMAEKGFMKKCGADAKVLISREDKEVVTNVLGNGEWVSAIECIGMNGYSLPPFIICQGQQLEQSWIDPALDQNAVVQVNSSGWTDQDMALAWLGHFDKWTKDRTRGQYRLLVLDGHSCHHTIDFVEHCERERIIPLCLPPRTTHVLQPLDTEIFGALANAYKQLASQQQSMFGVQTIDNRQFLLLYQEARQCIAHHISSAWKSVGLCPFNPSKVLLPYRPRTAPFVSLTDEHGRRVDIAMNGDLATKLNAIVEEIYNHSEQLSQTP